jgi:hypothetical protein
MQSLQLFQLGVSALGGSVVGAVAHRWLSRQKIDQMQQRLLRSEEARNGAIERSVQAREQIAQLSKAISDMRKAHHTTRSASASTPSTTADERRALAERALSAAADCDAKSASASASSGKVVLFANTEPMEL